ncbi:hypothetical protein ACS5NO_12730 [Larkinella sp. GY13]|uniref:hypothetical protein n=1 Tax=Larkinella sp. GY13 TaxID=3453720 RepID=UPI003EF00386
MSKNTQSGGSLLMRLLPSFAKSFLENASQEDVLKAEQEAAVLNQKLEAALPGDKPVEAPADLATAQARITQLESDLTAQQKIAGEVTGLKSTVTELQDKLATAEADRDKYKAWHDKQSASGTKLPGNDAVNRTQPETAELSAATADALALLRKRKALV